MHKFKASVSDPRSLREGRERDKDRDRDRDRERERERDREEYDGMSEVDTYPYSNHLTAPKVHLITRLIQQIITTLPSPPNSMNIKAIAVPSPNIIPEYGRLRTPYRH